MIRIIGIKKSNYGYPKIMMKIPNYWDFVTSAPHTMLTHFYFDVEIYPSQQIIINMPFLFYKWYFTNIGIS